MNLNFVSFIYAFEWGSWLKLVLETVEIALAVRTPKHNV